MAAETNDTRLVTIVLVVAAALVLVPTFVMGFGMMGYGSMMGGTWGSGMWGDGMAPVWMLFVGGVMPLLFLAVLVGAVYLVYRAATGTGRGSDRALEELRLAYARGELSDDEYEQRRDALERDSE
jgi:putative membrane protein